MTEAERAAPHSNVHSLDEWRRRRRQRPEGERGAAWMRERRLHGRTNRVHTRPRSRDVRYSPDRARYVPAYSQRNAHGPMRRPHLRNVKRPGAPPRRLLLGLRPSKILKTFVWAGGIVALLAALLWWRVSPSQPLPEPLPPRLHAWAYTAPLYPFGEATRAAAVANSTAAAMPRPTISKVPVNSPSQPSLPIS